MAYRDNSDFEKRFREMLESENADSSFSRIRCPRCRWQPKTSSRWHCADTAENSYNGCLTSWNTFETRGKCPGCGHHWRWTDCLSCHQASPHEDWYEEERLR